MNMIVGSFDPAEQLFISNLVSALLRLVCERTSQVEERTRVMSEAVNSWLELLNIKIETHNDFTEWRQKVKRIERRESMRRMKNFIEK